MSAEDYNPMGSASNTDSTVAASNVISFGGCDVKKEHKIILNIFLTACKINYLNFLSLTFFNFL